jgi:hypothetical protein
MIQTDYTFDSPNQLVTHLISKRETLQLQQGNLLNWFRRASLWYNTSICSCKKKGLSEQIIVQGFKDIVGYSEIEKQKVKIAIGGSAAFVWNGEFLGNIL